MTSTYGFGTVPMLKRLEVALLVATVYAITRTMFELREVALMFVLLTAVALAADVYIQNTRDAQRR